MTGLDSVSQMIIILSAVLLLGRLGEYIFSKTSIPDMLWLVLAGILAGPVFNLIPAEILLPILPFFGAVALIIILTSGGASLRLAEVAKAAPRSTILALTGFIFSLVAAMIYSKLMDMAGLLPHFSTLRWIMIGSILGGTSALVVMPTTAGGDLNKDTARLLELESCITDALVVVVTMVLINLLVSGDFNPAQQLAALIRQIVVAALIGTAAGYALTRLMPVLAGKKHTYTVLLASFLILYSLVQVAGGNGALGVLIGAMFLGNAKDILARIHPEVAQLEWGDDVGTVHAHMTFFIKSFFFFLIGLMFPTSPRLILIGAGMALFLALFRIPAAWLSLWKSNIGKHDRRIVMICIPRGLAAGVMSTIPMQVGLSNMEALTPGIFATIVFSILFFAIGFALLKRQAAK